MIIEAVKIVMSVFPFIKEAFLWRDGPQAYVPPTPKQLLRRKAAVFLLVGSFFVNYLALSRLYESHAEDEKRLKELKDTQAKLSTLQAQYDQAQASMRGMVLPNNCVSPNQMFDLADQQSQREIEKEIKQGVLKRNIPTPKGKH